MFFNISFNDVLKRNFKHLVGKFLQCGLITHVGVRFTEVQMKVQPAGGIRLPLEQDGYRILIILEVLGDAGERAFEEGVVILERKVGWPLGSKKTKTRLGFQRNKALHLCFSLVILLMARKKINLS